MRDNKPTQPHAIVKFVARALAFKRAWDETHINPISSEEAAELTYLSFSERERYLLYPDYKLIELIAVEHIRLRSQSEAQAA